MALTSDEREQVRDEVGDGPDDADIDAAYDRTGSWQGAAAAILSRRLANILAGPDSFSVPGEYSESRSKQVDALTVQIHGLEVAAEAAVGGVGYLDRVPSSWDR